MFRPTARQQISIIAFLFSSWLVFAAESGQWTNVTNNVGGEKWGYAGVTMLAAVPGEKAVIAGVSEAGLWKTEDEGATWTQLGAKDKDRITNRPHQIVFDPKDAKRFWISGCYAAAPFETRDGGVSFRRLGNLNHADGVGVDFTDPERKTILLGLHEQVRSLHASFDGGQTWKKIVDTLPEKTNFTSDPIVIDSKTFIVNTAGYMKDHAWGIYRTTDAGATWTKVSDAGPSGPAVRAPDGAIYWGLTWGGGIIKSADQGLTWQKLGGPVKSNPLVIDAQTIAALAGNQLHSSKDGGKTWAPLGPPVPGKPNGLVYQSATKSLWSCQMSDKKSAASIHRLGL